MAAIETPSKIGLISKALVLLGEKPASSLSENRYGVTVGANLFELVYENELGSNRWRFAVTKAALSRLVAAPLNEWSYAYQLPSNCLEVIGTYPASQYEIYGDHLYTDAASVELDYLFKPEVSALPIHFSALLMYALALNMVKPVTESDDGATKLRQAYNAQRDRALFMDAQARPNRPIAHSPFTDVRG